MRRMKIMAEKQIGVEVPVWHDDVLFWYYPDDGTWEAKEGLEDICNKHKEDIDRIAKDMYSDDEMNKVRKLMAED